MNKLCDCAVCEMYLLKDFKINSYLVYFKSRKIEEEKEKRSLAGSLPNWLQWLGQPAKARSSEF